MIDIENISKNFEGLVALKQLDIAVQKGSIHGLIGPNGSGKTTLFNIVSGILKPSEGSVRILGSSIKNLKPNQITRLGIARTFQNIRLFGEMSLIENVMVGRHCRTKSGFFRIAFRTPFQLREEKEIYEKASECLEFVGLLDKKDIGATQLSYGEQRHLEIARALATDPEVLLLDEPAAGLNRGETDNLKSLILKIKEQGKTVFLIEHDMSLVMETCDLITVINFGEKIAEGNAGSIHNNTAVIEAYLGGGDFGKDNS